MPFEVAFKIKAKHGKLQKLIDSFGVSQKEFAELLGVSQGTLNTWLNLRGVPGKKTMQKLCELLGDAPENIFPETLRHPDFKKAKKETMLYKEIDIEYLPFYQVPQIAMTSDTPEEHAEDIDIEEAMRNIVSTLTPKEQEVIRHIYYEDKTLEATGNEMGISGNRVSQIQKQAIRKLKRPSCVVHLKKMDLSPKYTSIPDVFLFAWKPNSNVVVGPDETSQDSEYHTDMFIELDKNGNICPRYDVYMKRKSGMVHYYPLYNSYRKESLSLKFKKTFYRFYASMQSRFTYGGSSDRLSKICKGKEFVLIYPENKADLDNAMREENFSFYQY